MNSDVSASTAIQTTTPAEVRNALLGGRVTDQDIAAALDLSVWTVRYRLNLPCVRVGRVRLYDLEECREKLGLARTAREAHAPRGRGRPQKAA